MRYVKLMGELRLIRSDYPRYIANLNDEQAKDVAERYPDDQTQVCVHTCYILSNCSDFNCRVRHSVLVTDSKLGEPRSCTFREL